jgi:hypothetical protein
VPTAGMAAALQHVEKTDKVGLAVPMRLDERIANTGLSCEVNDVWKLIRGKERRHRGAIGNIKLFEPEAPEVFEFRQPCSLESNVVIAVQVVETDNRTPLLEQATRDVETDKTGGSGHQNRSVIRHGARAARMVIGQTWSRR